MKLAKKKKRIKIVSFAAIVFIAMHLLIISQVTNLFERLELDLYDYQLKSTNKDKRAHEDIAIIAIDEVSLDVMQEIVGRWPWDRKVWEELLDYLSQAGAKTIFFDVKFTEYTAPPKNGELHPSDQALFMGTLNSARVVHAAQIVNEPEYEDNYQTLNLPLPSEAKTLVLKNESGISEFNKYFLPYPELLEASDFLGSIDMYPDTDGVYRSISPLRSYNESYVKTLALAPLLSATEKFSYDQNHLRFRDYDIPLYRGRALINMVTEFNTYSASSIFASLIKNQKGEKQGHLIEPDVFKDKYVFIGATAVGLQDIKAFSPGIQPGVYGHASLLDTILSKKFIRKAPEYMVGLITLVLVLLATGGGIFLNTVGTQFAYYLIPSLIYFLGARILFEKYYFWLPSVHILAPPLLAFLLAALYRTFYENKDKRFLKAAFKNYISPELIDLIHASGELPKLGGDTQFRTAFFTDIAGFSSFTEKLPPDKLVRLINEYLDEMTKILLAERGTLDKFMGDAIVACFGAPFQFKDHANRAARVAIQMQEKMVLMRERWKTSEDNWPKEVMQMLMRVGINSGDILAGNMGAVGRMNYTMMGDAVNLAARLESAAKHYGVLIHISKSVKLQLTEHYLIRRLDKVIVKGKSEPVNTFELLGYREQRADLISLVDLFHKGLDFYLKREFQDALELFTKSQALEDKRFLDVKLKTNPSEVYIQRCQQYLQDPPGADWQGISTLKDK